MLTFIYNIFYGSVILAHKSISLSPNLTRLVWLLVLRLRLSSEMDFTVEWFWSITRLSLVRIQPDLYHYSFWGTGFRLKWTSRLSDLVHNSLILGPNPTRFVPLFVLRHRLSSEMNFTVEWFWPITRLSLVRIQPDLYRYSFWGTGFRLKWTSRLSNFWPITRLLLVRMQPDLYRYSFWGTGFRLEWTSGLRVFFGP